MPVVCQCHKRWCLDCGRDAHWPITCAQFNTYTKMLKQNGEFRGNEFDGNLMFCSQSSRMVISGFIPHLPTEG